MKTYCSQAGKQCPGAYTDECCVKLCSIPDYDHFSSCNGWPRRTCRVWNDLYQYAMPLKDHP